MPKKSHRRVERGATATESHRSVLKNKTVLTLKQRHYAAHDNAVCIHFHLDCLG
jgi:hypothetical protein